MSADASVTFDWADGTYKFRLAIGQLRELQDNCNAGPMEILDRVRGVRWRVEDLIETIRLGLIGGGATPEKALVLVRRYVEDRPMLESQQPAMIILMAAIIGVPGDHVGKKPAEETAKETATTAASSSPPSTETAPQSASRRKRSTRVPSGNTPPASKDGTQPTASLTIP